MTEKDLLIQDLRRENAELRARVPQCGMIMTNADRIRSMTDEELAMFLCDFRSCDADEYICEGCKAAQYCHAGHAGTIDWLQQPPKGE